MKHPTRRLLLVEDEAIIGLAEAALLRKGGFAVDVVTTAEDAVRKVERDPSFDLVLMDIELGYGGDGVDAASRILRVRDLPIVFLTGHMDQEAVKRTEGVDAYGIVVKDSGEAVLLSSIETALKLHSTRRNSGNGHGDETMTIEIPPPARAYDASPRPAREAPSNTRPPEPPPQPPAPDDRWIQEILDQASERYHALYESASLGVYVHDLQGRFLDANDTALSWLGCTREEVRLMTFPSLLEEEQRPVAEESFRQIIRNGCDPTPREWCLRRRDGAHVWVEAEGSILYHEGRPRAIHVIARDITSRRRELTELENEYRIIGKLNDLGLELASLSSTVSFPAYVARTLKDLTGAVAVTYGDYLQEQQSIVIRHLDNDARLLDHVRGVVGIDLATLVSHVDEYHLHELVGGEILYRNSLTEITFGAVPRPVSTLVKSLLGITRLVAIPYAFEGVLHAVSIVAFKEGTPVPSPQLLRSFASLIAVTLSRLRAEEDLRESEGRFRSVYENTLIGIYRSTPDGRILMANPALIAMLGYASFADLAFRKLDAEGLTLAEDREAFTRAMQEEGQIVGMETRWRRRDGSTIWVREGAQAIKDAEGRVLYFDGTVEDLSGRKQIEAALQRSLVEKEALFHELQHRVKNSLTTIGSLVNLERDRWPEGDVRDVLRTLGDRVHSIASLYSQLYASGSTHEVRLDEYIRSIAGTLSRAYIHDRTDIVIRTECEPLVVDTRRAVPIGLIMNECITNALKHAFSDGSPGTISIVAGESQDGIFLEVSDDGVGMPVDFNPERSPGMGLHLVRMLADQLKGVFIWKTNGGTMFRVQIPGK